MSNDWFSNFTENSRIRRTNSFDQALKLIEEETEGVIGEDTVVSMRGTMTSVGESYEVPGLEEKEDDQLNEDLLSDLSTVEPRGGNPVPDYMANIDQALQWGNEKGPDTEWIRTASYAGEKANVDHCWSAMNKAPYNLNQWNISEENQSMTRPVLFIYDNEIVDQSRGGYDTGLPEDPEERAQAIDYAVVVDQDPTSDNYEI